MNRDELLKQMNQGRRELEDALTRVPQRQMDEPALSNQWSIKDLLGHLGFWERRVMDLYKYYSGGPVPDPPPGKMTTDELNHLVFSSNRGVDLEELAESEQVAYQALLKLATLASESDLFDPQRFPMTEGNAFVDWIARNSYGHYEEHMPDLRAWLGLPGKIAYLVEDKVVGAYAAHPVTPGPGVIVLHAWWGLNSFFQQFCDLLAQSGFTVLAPDLNDGKVVSTVDDAKALMEARNSRFTHSVVLSALDHLRRQPTLRAGPVGVIGFSMGAAWSLVLTEEQPEAIAAAVLFYGSYQADFAKSRATYLGHFAEQDEWEPEEEIQQMESAMKSAGREAAFYKYPGTGHWFFESNRPDVYRPEAAQLAWERTLNFLKTKLG